MRVIYEPKGRAREYAELAVNTYLTCDHQCKYCFAPSVSHMKREDYHAVVQMRQARFANDFAADCQDMLRNRDTRRVHMNFLSDPYPVIEATNHITRSCIEIAKTYGVRCNVLTKGKYHVVRPDFGLFHEADVHFGVTCCWHDDSFRKEWEPNASSVQDRVRLLKEAHNMGIYTWVSMEPVISTEQALSFFEAMHPWVDLWKVGKLNYHPHSKTVDWADFRDRFVFKAKSVNANYIIKKDLLEAK